MGTRSFLSVDDTQFCAEDPFSDDERFDKDVKTVSIGIQGTRAFRAKIRPLRKHPVPDCRMGVDFIHALKMNRDGAILTRSS